MRRYRQLTQGERSSIGELRKAGRSVRSIAQELGRSASTISRELRRNLDDDGTYWCVRAHQKAMKRRERGPTKLRGELLAYVVSMLHEHWSPEQISGVLRYDLQIHLSTAAIYAMVWSDHRAGGCLWRQLRRQANRRRRKSRHPKIDYGPIRDRVSVKYRPREANERQEYGHWEVDLVEGQMHSGYLLVAVERKSRLVRVAPVPRKQPDRVEAKLVNLLTGYRVKTLTFDNGSEFAAHLRVGAALGAKTYFCQPYASWEKGAVENMNGLLRQYFPKKRCLARVHWREVQAAEQRLNTRPRKTLNYLPPYHFEDQLIDVA